jgi:glycosyltransferase involved in cell wall biosynthesis
MIDARVRILFLVSTLRQTGPTTQLLNIVRHLNRERFDPVVVTLSSEPGASMLNAFEELGARVMSLRISRTRSLFRRQWREDIERLVGADLRRGCVIHSQGIRADVIASRHLDGLVRMTTARNYPYDDYVMKYGPVLGRWMARTHLQAFRALPLVVACSSTVASRLRSHGIETTVVRNGVDTQRFSSALPEKKAELRAEMKLARNARVGVCVGSLIARKDPLSVVRAIRALHVPDLVVVFVGGGSLEAQSRREAHSDERIRFTGHIENVLSYLQAADFFISASRSEGMPNAALEALACGLPVVLSDIEPHRELLETAPTAGELFALDDIPALAGAIRQAAGRTTSARGLLPVQAAEILGAERVSRRYQEIYLRLNREASRA